MYLLTKEHITPNMLSANNDKSSAVNGRLRPRKPSIALPPPARSKSLRRSEVKIADHKTSKANSSKNERKLERSVNKPEPPSTLDFLCPYCDKKFASKKSVSKHVGSRHSVAGGGVACQFCSHAAGDPQQLMRHMLDAHHNRYFACLDCRTRFTSSNELKEHESNLCRKLKPPGKSHRNSLCQSKEKDDTKKISSNKDGAQPGLEDDSEFKGIVIACELKPNQIEDPADIESNITTNLILPTNKNIVGSATMLGKGPVLVRIDDIQWNKRMAGHFSFHNSEADQILSRLGVVHRSPGAAAAIPRSHTYKYIEESTKFEKCFDTAFYSKVASNVQENLEKFLDGSFNRTPLDPDSIIKTRKSKNLINTAEGFPILLSSEQFSRNVFGAFLPRAIAPRHKWKRDSIDNERNVVCADQLLRDSHANNCIVTLVSSLDIWTQLCMRRKFEDKYNNTSFNEKRTEKQHVISNELKEILESRELPKRVPSDNKCERVAPMQVEGLEFPMSLGLRPSSSQKPPPQPQPALLSGEWVRPRCFVCCACGDHTRDPKALVNHLSTHHPTANVSHYDIAGELLCNDDTILKHLYVPSNQTPNRTRPLRGIRECTKCGKSISLEELHQHMLECAGDTPVVKRKCRNRPFGVRRRRPRMPDNTIRKKIIRRNISKRKTRQQNKIRSRSTMRSEVGDAETIRKMIADLPAKRHRASESNIAASPHWNRKRDTTLNKLLRNRPALDNAKNIEKQHTQKGSKNSLKTDPKVKKKENGNTSKNGQANAVALRPVRVASRILRKGDLKRKNALRRSPRSANQPIETQKERQSSSKSIVCISSAVQTDELSLHASSDRVDVNRSRGRTSEHAARSNSSSSTPRQSERAGDNGAGANANTTNNNNNQQERSQIKHSIARLTANTVTHDKSVQFQPHFLVNQECSKSNSKPYLLSEPQVFYENDIMAARLDKPPLVNYDRPVDLYAFQKSKLNKPRKKLNDCIAMLKNKLVEPPPPPPLPNYSMHQPVHREPAVIPLNYAPQEMMTPLNMIADCQYDMATSIPYAHANTNAVSIISGPLDLSGKRSTNDEYFSTEYETLDLSQKRNSHSYNPYHMSDEDVVVDLCMKSVQAPNIEESLDLSRRSKQFDESPISMTKKPCESRSIEQLPMYEYDFNASQYNNHSMFHQSTDLVYPQQALDYNIENRSVIQSIPRGYPIDLECENITETNILPKNMISPNVDQNVAIKLRADHHSNKKVGAYSTTVQPPALVESDHSKSDVAASITVEKDSKLQCEAAVDDAAKKIALLPKEIVEILGKMPTDHRNQLLDVLPQYMGCNTSVKQLKLVVDINPEALIPPMGITALQSASTEIATQTLTSSVNSASTANFIDIDKRSIESAKEDMQKNAAITENIRVNIQGPPISCGVMAQDPISLQNSGLNRDISTPNTADKPKEVKEKTASSLRAVRIKTSSQRRRTQNALELKPTDHVPILGHSCLPTLQQNVLIQQAEVSSTQQSAISAENLKRFPSHEIGNLHLIPTHNTDSQKITETDINKQATVSIANDSTCGEIAPVLEIAEHNVKELINNDVVPVLPNKTDMIKNNESRNVVSDGDSEDDVSLAVIVKLKMAECQKPVEAKVKSDTHRQKKKRKTKKQINDDNCNVDIDSENNKHTTTSSGICENVSKETVTCIQAPDDTVNKIAPESETQSFYQGKKLRTRSTRSSNKDEQSNGFGQRPMQNETEDNFYNIQNKENNDQTHSNVDMHLTNSEHIDAHTMPREDINEQKDSEQSLAKVSCQKLQDFEEIQPKDDILKSKSNPKKRIKEKNVCKPKTIHLKSDPTKCTETQVKEPIDINFANIDQLNISPLTKTNEIDVMKSLSSTATNDVEKNSVYKFNRPDDDQDIIMSENPLIKCNDSKTQLKTNSLQNLYKQSNRNLRRSRRGKSEIDDIQAPSSTRRDSSSMLLSLSHDFDGNEKILSDSYVEQIDPPLLSEKILTHNEVNANLKSSNKEILENVEIKCEKNINICNKDIYSKNKKLDIIDDSLSLKSLEIYISPESKEPKVLFKTSESSQKEVEKENTEKHSAVVETTTTALCNLSSMDNFSQKDNSTTLDKITITEPNKLIKPKKKSKSFGKSKDKNQGSNIKMHTNNIGQSSLDDPTPSDKPNVFGVSDTNKDYLSMSPNETRKSTTCYNLPKESAVTRSKSSLSKSDDGNSTNYDPYDIDQEDNLLEKILPLKKVPTNRKIFSGESLPNKSQASESSNNFTHKKTTKTITSLSDSDDSSKSDVPLKKLVDEKLDRKNKSIKSVKSQAEEPKKACDTNAPPSTLSEDESLRSEQFMESFGFFSERRPRKSNIIASKKISETFQNDDISISDSESTSNKIDRSQSVSNLISGDFPIKCSMCSNARKNRKCRKRRPSKDVTFTYCSLCEKAFRRQDNYLRHIMSQIHLTNVLLKEMNCDVEPILEQPNCLIVYRQHLERIKRLTDKIKKKNKKLGITASPPKFELPSLTEIIAEAKMHTYTSPGVERRGLSRDEALFIDCCELLKESHKNEPVETVTLETGGSQHIEVINPIEKIIAEDRADCKSDGDVDSITAKTILESEEVRNLENDLLCGLKEAAAKRHLEMNNQIQSPNSQSLDNFDLDLDSEPVTLDHSSVAKNLFQPTVSEPVAAKFSSPKAMDSCSEEPNIVVKKPKKTKTTKVITEIAVDIYEDKFDKIKRKCRSQAAAAKAAPAITEPNTSSTTKKKSETKKNKKTHKNVKQNAIPTKGALKGFECMKFSESVENASSSEPGYELTPPSKRKKSSYSSKKERREPFKRSSEVHCSNVLPRTRADIYEFMDNDDSDALQFRRSLNKDKFKTFKDTPSTSRAIPMQQAYESSASGSDVDDFVYMSDDYLCSADETENSLLSSEPSGNCKKPPKRKEALEKNAVMGKIFKHNAVRNERKHSSSGKETTKATKANLDQLFDSLLEDEPNSSMLKDDADFPSSNRALSPAVVVADASAATTGSQSGDDSTFNSPPRERTTKRKKSRQNKKIKQKRSKIHVEEAMDGTTHKKARGMLSGKVLAESTYVVAQHRARRACAVGKQNVLAESWSSESESDTARANAVDAAAQARKKKSKKNKHSAIRQQRHVSFGKYEKGSKVRHRVVDEDGGSEPTTELNEKQNRRESRGRSRTEITYFSSSEEEEEAHPQQHGWIVGNSHKKLVTMLAHAKGRKRDDKRSYID